MTFKELGLKSKVLDALDNLGFEKPTPIQEQAIPKILEEGGDLVGLAQTGTGKTAAFGLPMINLIDFKSKKTQDDPHVFLLISWIQSKCFPMSN